MARAVRIAGIQKEATPHSLRHSFACHTYEYTCDLRKIQKILGHVHLETTTLYVRVARPMDEQAVRSPLDVMMDKKASQPSEQKPPVAPVGNLRIHARAEPDDKPGARVAKVTLEVEADGRPVYLTGIVARESRRGWMNLSIPPLEQWGESLRWLPPEQRTRIEQPAFYEVLQREIPRRLLNSGSG